jgi:polyhydroxyalkanoate synthesis regulator phasin
MEGWSAWIEHGGLSPVTNQNQETAYIMSLIDTARNISLLAKRGVTVELVEQIMKLREEALAMQEENVNLKARVRELERRVEALEDHSFDGTVFWRTDGPQK